MSQIVVVFDVNDDCPRRDAARTLCQALIDAAITTQTTDSGTTHGYIESWWYADYDLKDIDRNDNRAMVLVDDDEPRIEIYVDPTDRRRRTTWHCHRCGHRTDKHFADRRFAEINAKVHECEPVR